MQKSCNSFTSSKKQNNIRVQKKRDTDFHIPKQRNALCIPLHLLLVFHQTNNQQTKSKTHRIHFNSGSQRTKDSTSTARKSGSNRPCKDENFKKRRKFTSCDSSEHPRSIQDHKIHIWDAPFPSNNQENHFSIMIEDSPLGRMAVFVKSSTALDSIVVRVFLLCMRIGAAEDGPFFSWRCSLYIMRVYGWPDEPADGWVGGDRRNYLIHFLFK